MLTVKISRALGEGGGDLDAEGVLGEEGGHAADLRAESRHSGGGRLVFEPLDVKLFGGATERAPQAVERQLTFGQNVAARLEFAEGVEDESLGLDAAVWFFTVEEGGLAHDGWRAGRDGAAQGSLTRRGRSAASGEGCDAGGAWVPV